MIRLGQEKGRQEGCSQVRTREGERGVVRSKRGKREK